MRDRDRIRQEILESLGWKNRSWRIWSTDWFRNKEMALDILVENVNRAINKNVDNDSCSPEKSDDNENSDELTSVPFRNKKEGVPNEKAKEKCNRKIGFQQQVLARVTKNQLLDQLYSLQPEAN